MLILQNRKLQTARGKTEKNERSIIIGLKDHLRRDDVSLLGNECIILLLTVVVIAHAFILRIFIIE